MEFVVKMWFDNENWICDWIWNLKVKWNLTLNIEFDGENGIW